jgi:hypothetical protein
LSEEFPVLDDSSLNFRGDFEKTNPTEPYLLIIKGFIAFGQGRASGFVAEDVWLESVTAL